MRAFTTTRRWRWLGERSDACRFSRSATAWPRPIREHLPLPAAPPRRVPPLNWAWVSGPPLALAAAFITWATKDCDRRPLARPRSRMRPVRGRKSEASSRLMGDRSNAPIARQARSGWRRTNECENKQLAWSPAPAPPAAGQNRCADKDLREAPASFNLALLIGGLFLFSAIFVSFSPLYPDLRCYTKLYASCSTTWSIQFRPASPGAPCTLPRSSTAGWGPS